MKKIIKVITLIIISCLIICGCEKEEDFYENDDVYNELINNIDTNEIGFFNGEYNDKNIVLETKNNNNKPLYLNYSFEVFDKNKNKLFNKEVIVRVGTKDKAYVIGIQDLEEPSFDSYTYTISILNEEIGRAHV